MEALGSYDKEMQEVESMSPRGEVTSELEITDSGLEEVKGVLGFSPEEVLPRA